MKGTIPALLVLLLLVAPSAVDAQFEYTTNADNTLTITGFSGDGVTDYSGGVAVAIPPAIGDLTVTGIGTNAFGQCYEMTNVTIPGTVTTVEDEAFQSCTSLVSVSIPASVNSIGLQVFADCSSLTAINVDAQNSSYSSVDGVLFNKGSTILVEFPAGVGGSITISNSVTDIGDYAFYDCVNLSSVIVPDSVTRVGNLAFAGCRALTNIVLGNGVTSIGNYAFGICGVTSVNIPGSVANIGENAFAGCAGLTNVIISNGVSNIGSGAFSDSGLISITIPGSVTNIASEAFYGCYSLADVTLGDGLAYIGVSAFSDCAMTNVTIPGSVTNIDNGAFEYCTELKNATISYGVTTIGYDAFCETGLTSVTIPSSVTNIGEYAFETLGLAAVYFGGNAPSDDANDLFISNPTVYYLPGTSGWAGFATNTGLVPVLWNPLIQANGASFGLSNNNFGFNITGTTNIPIVVEACANLANPIWTPLQTLNLTNSSYYFSEPFQPNSSGRFYRISSP